MSFQVSDLLSFDKMVTPVLIKVIYWLGVAMILLSSLLGLLTAFSPFGSGIKGVLVSLLGMVIGVLFWRVWCELMIVVFNIYDVLKDIRNRGSGLS